MPSLAQPLAQPLTRPIAARIDAALSEGGGVWWDATSVLDADFTNGRFRWNGVSYTDENTFLAAIGGSKSGITRTIGPYVAPGATEMISNGGMSGGTTGWTPGQSSGGPATVSVVSGELEMNGQSANSPAASQPVTTVAGRAYQARGKTRRGAANTTQGTTFAISNAASLAGAQHYGTGARNDTGTLVEAIRNFAMHGTTAYVGLRAVYNPATQLYNLDDVSVKACVPFDGFTAGQCAGVIRGMTPAAASGNKVVWQADADQLDGATIVERNFIRLVYDNSGNLRLISSYQTALNTTVEQANLNLGAVAVSTAFIVAFSAADNAFSASLDGQPAVTDSSGLFPGCAVMRICRSQTGDTWDGSISRVTLF